MLSNTKQTNPANPQKSTFLQQVRKRIPVSTDKFLFQNRLAIIILLAFFVLLNIPLSGGAAHAPEWTSPSNDLPFDVYLPLVVKNFPFTPPAPVLDPISNDDGDGNYTVTWSAAEGAETYLLQEDDHAAFSSPSTAYEGSITTKAISGKVVGSYYYRVMASNAYASSGWSSAQSVTVSVTPPACPQTGSWQGTTSQGLSISYIVENSPQCQIAPGSLEISYLTASCGYATTTYALAFPITDNKFSATSAYVRVPGEFTSSDMADGNFYVDFYLGNTRCYRSGTWEAYPVVGADGPVYALLVQPDNKILVGGDFSEVGQQPHNNIARLNPDGSLDATFNPDLNDTVNALAIQPDNKILVGGDFTQVDEQVHAGIVRLNPDGSLDTGFNPQIDGWAAAVALQSDGKILVGGYFSTVNEEPHRNFARLNSNGTLDAAFNVDANYPVYALVVQSDDKILVVGNFDNLFGEYWADNFVRLNSDGTLDTSFQPDFGINANALALQADGKIVVVGSPQLDPYAMARFTSEGNLDTSFTPPLPNEGLDGGIGVVALQTSGRVIIGGAFRELDGVLIKNLAQLNTDGTLNPAFNPAPNADIYALAVQPDNKILVGGGYSKINGQVRHSIVRLNADGTLDESFAIGP